MNIRDLFSSLNYHIIHKIAEKVIVSQRSERLVLEQGDSVSVSYFTERSGQCYMHSQSVQCSSVILQYYCCRVGREFTESKLNAHSNSLPSRSESLCCFAVRRIVGTHAQVVRENEAICSLILCFVGF